MKQNVINQLDLLPNLVYNNLGFNNLNKSSGFLVPNSDPSEPHPALKDNLKVSISNGGRVLLSDLVSIKVITEMNAQNKMTSNGLKPMKAAITTTGPKTKMKINDKDLNKLDKINKSSNGNIPNSQNANYNNTLPESLLIQTFREYIGRLSSFSFHKFHNSKKVYIIHSEVVLPNLVVGSASTPFGCEEFTPREKSILKEKIVLIKRGGGCSFVEKTKNAILAGAKALLISIDSDALSFSESEKEIDEMYKEYSVSMRNDLWQYGGLIKIGDPSVPMYKNLMLKKNIIKKKSRKFKNTQTPAKRPKDPIFKSIKDLFNELYSFCYVYNRVKQKKTDEYAKSTRSKPVKPTNKIIESSFMPVISVYKEFYEAIEKDILSGKRAFAQLL
ncbi:hypothetical protein AYI69_g6430 [Smittium culicis]|uniref:PA domain-containing protein n=1 Tax=Smittium culicis TaxID=133412 RepID=A0A1R1XZ02_9FUNG|nr:hypothetical protein AYI69_g6430 [Smittium culicis]